MTTRILAAVDLTDSSMTASVLERALAHARVRQAAVVALAVVPDIVTGIDYRYAIRGETGGSQDFDMRELVTHCLERLNEVVADHTPEGVEVETVSRHGSIYEQVIDVAEAYRVDEIVMGARSPSRIGDFLLGSNAARVVRHARCTVTVIRG